MLTAEYVSQTLKGYDVETLYHDYGYFAESIQHPAELKLLLDVFVDQNPRNILEIGSWKGGTLYYWLKHSSNDSKVISVDVDHSHIKKVYKNWDIDKNKLHMVTGDSCSEDSLSKVKEIIKDEPIDFVFIDGLHDWPQPFNDFALYYPLVNKHLGIIALHDVRESRCPGVEKAWSRITKMGFVTQIFNAHSMVMGIGLVYL